MTSFMMRVKSGSNWPSSGEDIARSTRGSAMVGPGPMRMRAAGIRSGSRSSLNLVSIRRFSREPSRGPAGGVASGAPHGAERTAPKTRKPAAPRRQGVA